MQVVSGQKLVITMKIGVTDKLECKEVARDRIVSSSECNHQENVSFWVFFFVIQVITYFTCAVFKFAT